MEQECECVKETECIFDVIARLMNKRCVIETSDGSIRHGTVMSIEWQTIELDGEEVGYPRGLWFDEAAGDGVDFRAILKIAVEEPTDAIED